jgi:tRNA A-37 threonylcarbamoyl transferase component Bud32
MSPPRATPETLSRLNRADEVCLRFEDDWRAGKRPRLEEYVAAVPPAEQGDLLVELLLVEWTYRLRGQDSFYQDEYGRRFAAHAASVSAAWQRWKAYQGSFPSTVAPQDTGCPRLAPLPDQLLPVLPGYSQIEPIGQGGMGEVFRAYDESLKRKVALKRIRVGQESSERLRRFRTEAEALAKMGNPHIVGVYSCLEDARRPILVMEYVANGTLADRLGTDASLPPAEAARLVAILAWAVHAAHTAGVVHRDLKPDNVLMADPVPGSPDNILGGFPKVTDFGLAALADTPGGPTIDGDVFGTPAYMAPEQAAGKTREIGPACDVWALGVILYRCLTGLVPFKGDSVLDTLERVRTMQFRAPRQVQPEIPADLEAICLACLEKDPTRRPTAKDLAGRLQQFAGGASVSTAVWRPSPLRSLRGRPWLAAAAVVLAAGILAVALAVARRGPRPAPDTPGQPLRVAFDVANFELFAGEDHWNGAIGKKVFVARIGERVVIRAELSEPAYCYLVACNFDGRVKLLSPCDEATAEELPDKKPEQVKQLRYPPPTLAGPKTPSEQRGIQLDDDAEGGLQAYLVVASREPLPAYRDWSSARGKPPWRKLPPTDGVWRSSGETLDPVTPGEGLKRGSIVTLKGQPPLIELCRWAAGQDVVVEAIAFPVKKREGK